MPAAPATPAHLAGAPACATDPGALAGSARRSKLPALGINGCLAISRSEQAGAQITASGPWFSDRASSALLHRKPTTGARSQLAEMHENWLWAPRYLNMDDLREHRKEALLTPTKPARKSHHRTQ